jgi:hypothetical protein
MASIYRTMRTGSGTSYYDPFRAQGFDGIPSVTVMLEPTRPHVFVMASRDDITGPGITRMLTAPNLAALQELARTTYPTAQEYNSIRAWANSAPGIEAPPAGLTWAETLNYVTRQVNGGTIEKVYFSE